MFGIRVAPGADIMALTKRLTILQVSNENHPKHIAVMPLPRLNGIQERKSYLAFIGIRAVNRYV